MGSAADVSECFCYFDLKFFSEHAGAEVTKRWFLLMRSTPGNSWKNALQ